MRTHHLLIAGLGGLLLTAGPALAQDRGDRDRGRWGRGPDLPRQTMDQLRDEADKNNDGELDRVERDALRDAIQMAAEKREIEMIAKYDKDGDGQLSPEERLAARKAEAEIAAKKRADRWEELFGEIDTNDDGSVSKEEWLAARGTVTEEGAEAEEAAEDAERDIRNEERRMEFMKQWDKDGDGELNEAERRAIRDAWRERMGDRGPRDRRPQREGAPQAEGDGELEL